MTLSGRVLLITGGTGSFGNAMTRHALAAGAAEVRVISRDEAKQDQMRRAHGDGRIKFFLGDVRDRESIRAAVAGVDYVFHAAALKQVPSCEFFPLEAVATNVTGSANVIRASQDADVAGVVLLGTDKAVQPINAMGMSKALMEKVAQATARASVESDTIVSCVRYGNVMYSRGSVIPAFVDAARTGQPMLLTDPDMTRFLLSLTTAVDLVEHALIHAESGDLFIRKAAACTIGDLARAVSNLFGVEHRVDVIGVRHGEKTHETLATAEELARGEETDLYWRVPMDARDLNYGLYFDEGDFRRREDYTSATTVQLSVPEVEELLLSLPEVRNELAAEGRAVVR